MTRDDKTSNESLLTEEEEKVISHVKEEEPLGNGFVIQLLICSLLTWSLLFLTHYEGCEKIIAQIDEMLSSQSHLSIITTIGEKLTEVIQEIL